MMVINSYTQKHVIEYFDTNVIHRAFSQRVLWDNVIATDKSLLWREGGIKKFGEGIHNSITRGRPASQRPTQVPNGSEEEKKRERWSFSFLSLILRPFNHNHKSGRDSKVFHAMRLFPSIFVPSVCYPDKVDKYSD